MGMGDLRNWWTDEDREAFEKRTQSLVDRTTGSPPPKCPMCMSTAS
jgi:predicted metalloendopeptidase